MPNHALISYSLPSYVLVQLFSVKLCPCTTYSCPDMPLKPFSAKLCPCTAIPCEAMPFDSIGGTTGREQAGISEGSVPHGHPFSYEVHSSALGLKPATNRLNYVTAKIL
jgi:hypothetical protein